MSQPSAQQLFDLAGRVALVTGGTRGIGETIAAAYAAAGARVYLHGRDVELGEAVARRIGGTFIAGDLADLQQVHALADTIAARESKLHVLVNNAAYEIHTPLLEMDLDKARRLFDVNCWHAIELTRRLHPLLRASGNASVINVTSIHESTPVANNGPYAMSKAAMAMFTRTAAIEWGEMGIRVNNFAPGAIETDMNRRLIHEIGLDKWRHWIPIGRVGTCDEMIGPALFLASDASSYMTGATLTVDGGYQQHLVRYGRP
jgi:NAD(P)-dependent dehydrogenase (short-subunit alcohol dehydrogenase family)